MPTTLLRIFALLSFFLLLLFACKKDDSPTVIRGTVTDRKTGSPIEGAEFLLGFVTISDNAEYTKYVNFSTNSNGEFNHTEPADYDYINGGSSVYKLGYTPNHTFGISKGKDNILDITLLPEDAVLKVIIFNQTGQQNSFYFEMINPEVTKESNGLTAYYFLETKPLMLLKDEEHIEYFKLPESKNYLYWDFTPFQPTSSSSFKDTILVFSNDTVEYKITY